MIYWITDFIKSVANPKDHKTQYCNDQTGERIADPKYVMIHNREHELNDQDPQCDHSHKDAESGENQKKIQAQNTSCAKGTIRNRPGEGIKKD